MTVSTQTVALSSAEPDVMDARVLIVEDDRIIRAQLSHQVGKLIREVRLACDGVEGLATWRDWRPDVTLTDIFMPGMDGLEMSAAIKSDDPNAQIIVITSDKEGGNLHRALEIGVERYITKPVDIRLLKDAVHKCLRDRQQIEELFRSRESAAVAGALRDKLLDMQRAEIALQKEKDEQQILIKRLEEAHNQLLQSEKMASIGQLAAGVAHEINNPIGFVNSNLSTLQNYVEKLLGLLSAYEAHDPALPPAAREEIAALKQKIDLAYLQEDIGSLLSESQGGLQRVKRIVQDLKDFSHVGEPGAEWANLEEGLESTLNVVWSELKYKAEVIKAYGGIPQIKCIPAQLNQVFMNLLVNAAQAISTQGTITLRTGQQDDKVWVEIADTGGGIAPEHLNRIFDPFFTTKPVGTGTGLGLSITHGIVHKHNGTIEVHSEVGKGTTFRILLPIQHQPSDNVAASQ